MPAYIKTFEIDGVPARKCTLCSEVQKLTEFYKNPNTKLGVGSHCKKCTTTRLRNSDKIITDEDYDKLFAQQNGMCAICADTLDLNQRNTSAFGVDHNHKTGEIRGILCRQCNSGLGMFKDSMYILLLAHNYLKRYE